MLTGGLYQVKKLQTTEDVIEADIILNPSHGIFKGHYPDQPVLPGACMLNMVKEVLEQALSGKMKLANASQIKFLQMVVPDDRQILHLKITHKTEQELLKVTALLSLTEAVCFKFNGYFQKV